MAHIQNDIRSLGSREAQLIRVLYDGQIFRLQQYGGISRYFFEIANRIAEMESASVEIFAPLYINEYFNCHSAVRPDGLKIPRSRVTGHISDKINLWLSQLSVKPRGDVDIFHETYYSEVDTCPRSAKRVVTVYDMIHEKCAEHFSEKDKTSYIKAKAISRADHIICISESTRQDLIEVVGVPHHKTSVVYLGHSLSKPTDFVKPVQHHKPFLLYVGARYRYKNFDGMLSAYSRSNILRENFSIVCFGGGPLDRRELQLIASFGLEPDSVLTLGGDDSTLAHLYSSAAALVYPSFYEGFGIPPLEAMAFGCPVVSSNTSSIPEVVGDAAELFDPTNIEEMSTAIERVVSSPDHTNRLIAKGLERVKKFSWEKCARDTMAVYEMVLQK